MKSLALETIHNNLHKQILLAQSYAEIPELCFIIKSCRLKPYSYVFEQKSEKIFLYKQWFDEFGNSLQIISTGKVEITYNDLSLDRNKIICTDLYYGLSLDKIAKISKLVYLCAGKDDDTYQDCFFLSFLGPDNYLRSYMYLYNEWQQVSPLLLGLKILKNISKNTDIKYFRQLENKDNTPLPCLSVQEWISFIPPNSSFIELINKQYDKLLPILKHENSSTLSTYHS